LASAEPQTEPAAEPGAELESEPAIEQRLSPWLTIRTTVKEQGLIVQVARPFRERVSAVGFDRLLLEPAEVCFVRADRLWMAGVLGAGGLLLSWPGLLGLPARFGVEDAQAWSAALGALWALLGPGLLAAAVLMLLLAVTEPRRLSVFLDREQGVHPKVVRGGADEPQAAAFVATVQQAIVHYRCAGTPVEETADAEAGVEDEAGARPSLADTLDALLAMQRDGLLDEQELARFREFAERR